MNSKQIEITNNPNLNKKKKSAKYVSRLKTIQFVFLTLFGVILMFPFLWAVGISLVKNSLYAYDIEYFLKPPYAFGNYLTVFKEAELHKYFLNTAYIIVMNSIGQVLANSFVGFGFTRYNFKGSNLLFMCALATMFLPGQVMTIPQYIIWNEIGFVDTYIPLILPAFFGNAMNIFLMRQTFKGMPGELYEAAWLDGANPIRIFFTIYFPLAKPMIATIVLRVFMGCWNDIYGPLIYITKPEKYTVSLGLRRVSEIYKYQGNIAMAAALVSIVPVLIVYAFCQKQFVAGLSAGAVKG